MEQIDLFTADAKHAGFVPVPTDQPLPAVIIVRGRTFVRNERGVYYEGSVYYADQVFKEAI